MTREPAGGAAGVGCLLPYRATLQHGQNQDFSKDKDESPVERIRRGYDTNLLTLISDGADSASNKR